jgi:hypothetical protein
VKYEGQETASDVRICLEAAAETHKALLFEHEDDSALSMVESDTVEEQQASKLKVIDWCCDLPRLH